MAFDVLTHRPGDYLSGVFERRYNVSVIGVVSRWYVITSVFDGTDGTCTIDQAVEVAGNSQFVESRKFIQKQHC